MLRLLPVGVPVWETSTEPTPVGFSDRFSQERELAILKLAGEEVDAAGPEWFRFWQRLAKEFLKRNLVAQRQGSLDLPSEAQWLRWCEQAPAHPAWAGANPAALRVLWSRLQDSFSAWTAKHGQDAEAALAAIAPALVECGRVTFHLVENKQSQEFPFAFVGTYAQLGKEGRVTQVPIGKMLREAAKTEDVAALRSVLEPLRQAVQGDVFLAELVESQRIFQALAFTPAEALAFLKATPVLAEAGMATRIPNWWQGRKGAKPQVLVNVEKSEEDEEADAASKRKEGADQNGGLLKFNVRLALRGEALTEEEVQAILETDAPLVSLKGQWVEVDAARLRAALQLWQKATSAQAQGIPLHVGLRWLAVGASAAAPQLGPEAAELADWTEIEAGDQFATLLAEFTSKQPSQRWPYGDAVPAVQATLRPYQLQGVQWLYGHAQMGWGACLADDMGLGKTLQVIALIATRMEEGSTRPSLIVAPASLLGNWRQEFTKFAPQIPVITLHRSQMRSDEIRSLDQGHHPALNHPGVVLTTYGMLLRLQGLAAFRWDGAILDEAQAIKNADTGQSASARTLQATFRIAMTGTPVENRLTELWSLFAFLNPGYLGTLGEFEALVKRCQDTGEGYGPLRRLVQPFLLRRLKSDPTVAPDLPGKTEMNAWCGLTKRQALLYQRAVKGLKEQLAAAKDDPATRQAAVLGILLKLKQICNHPSLFSGDGGWDAAESGKFRRLQELAEQIHASGEKMLVFTQFREMTDVLARELARLFRRPGLVLHGGTPVARRAELVTIFQDPSGPPFFVISLKAGGTGLNLTAASHVIHFDRWWNPAVEDQATDRAYRIGQKTHVLVHKFVCQGTLEERIDAIISEKKQLADEILTDGGTAEQLMLGLTDTDLDDFLKLQDEAMDD